MKEFFIFLIVSPLSLSQKLCPKGMGESFLADIQHNVLDVPTKQIVN